MKVRFSKEFIKKYKKVNAKIRKRVDKQILIFESNPKEPSLRNHPLRNEWLGYQSIDITADYRAIYEEVGTGEDVIAYFVDLGTHKELYG